jgi:hypothetical protein
MAPTVVKDGAFRLFFFSREETRMHVHVSHPDGEAKYWLEPSISLAQNFGLSAQHQQTNSSVTEYARSKGTEQVPEIVVPRCLTSQQLILAIKA